MGEKREPPPLDDLDARLKSAQARRDRRERRGRARLDDEAPSAGLSIGFRVATELVAGLLVGGTIGWLLDRWLDTSPWLLVVFFLLGSAAGMMNVYRAMAGFGLGAGYKKGDASGDGTHNGERRG